MASAASPQGVTSQPQTVMASTRHSSRKVSSSTTRIFFPSSATGALAGMAPSIIGNSSRNAFPTPSWLRTEIFPPWALTTAAATHRPRLPASDTLASSKIFPFSGSGMAAPVSWLTIWMALPEARVPTRTRLTGEWLEA